MSNLDPRNHLLPLDDLFTTQEERSASLRERIIELPLNELHPFKEHPFRVLDDERMEDTTRSIRDNGVLVPIIVRPRAEGGYEIIAGHRRKRGCERAGFETIPAIIRDMDDDTAVIAMVDSNIQRENLLPSERAYAYKMKMDAMKHQGSRGLPTSRQVVGKLETSDIVGRSTGDSGRTVQRFIRLTYLIPELMEMVDNRKIAFSPAIELSFLKPEEQKLLLEAMDSEQSTPSLSQAQRLKRFSTEGRFDENVALAIMSEEKGKEREQIVLEGSMLRKYFPKSYSMQRIEQIIVKLLEKWLRQRQQKAQETR